MHYLPLRSLVGIEHFMEGNTFIINKTSHFLYVLSGFHVIESVYVCLSWNIYYPSYLIYYHTITHDSVYNSFDMGNMDPPLPGALV
jgi:hypothetical protein